MKTQIKDKISRVSVDKIFPNPWNPNKQSDFVYEKERNSIRKFGFLDPVLVRSIPEGYEIIDGEHRWRAAQEEGLTEIPVNDLGKVSDSVAKQLTIIMNETRGRADYTELGKLMQDINADVKLEELLEVMPFVDSEMDAFLHPEKVASPADHGGASASSSDEGFRTVAFKLPESIAEQLEQQVTRFKQHLHPGEDPEDVSYVSAVEAIIQHVAQIPDDQLVG
jgi:hypothetical protein